MTFYQRVISFFSIPKKKSQIQNILGVDIYKHSFQELSQILKNCKYEVVFINRKIEVEWEIEGNLLKIEYDQEGQFYKLIHYKSKK